VSWTFLTGNGYITSRFPEGESLEFLRNMHKHPEYFTFIEVEELGEEE